MAAASPSAKFQVPGKPLNLTDVFLDRNLREGRGDKTALIVDRLEGEAERYTYSQVAAEANRYGNWLKSQGLTIEDRVFVILEDSLAWAAGFFGALKVGCTVMFINPRVSAEEIAFYLEDSRAKGLITSQAVADKLPQQRNYLKAILVVDSSETISEIQSQADSLEAAPTLEEDFAIWLYSSGSTGAPKAAVHRAYDFVYNTERYAKNVLQMSEKDVTLSVPKLFFGYATGSNLLFPFYFGGTAVLFADKPTPQRLFELTEKHCATILVNVPTMIAQMAALYEQAPEGEKPKLDSLRLLTSAGEALPPDLYRRWKEATEVEILDGIGSAEMFHVFISARLAEVVPGSLGTLVEGYQARIVGSDGEDCGPGQVGTLWIEGDSCAAFYWNRQEKSRDTLRGRWVVSGDQFEQDEKGYFYYRGRADDLMKIAGRWVAPQEVEDALTRHETVGEAGVSSFKRDGLLKPMAFVLLKEGLEGSEELKKQLSQHVADSLAPYKAPRIIEFVDSLPRGDRDKLDRKALKQMAQKTGEAQ